MEPWRFCWSYGFLEDPCTFHEIAAIQGVLSRGLDLVLAVGAGTFCCVGDSCRLLAAFGPKKLSLTLCFVLSPFTLLQIRGIPVLVAFPCTFAADSGRLKWNDPHADRYCRGRNDGCCRQSTFDCSGVVQIRTEPSRFALLHSHTLFVLINRNSQR